MWRAAVWPLTSTVALTITPSKSSRTRPFRSGVLSSVLR